ncbi:unnamed protein product [Ectocarpus sp. CCAP 1310/34]|nr:unnamed protein product [Ectocarpus sp. CCAP 1310/34]
MSWTTSYLWGEIFQCGNAYLQDPIVFTRFIDSLPSEYEVSKETLASTIDLIRDTLIRVVVTRFRTISKKAARAKAPKAVKQAFLARDGGGGQRGGRSNGRNKRGKGGGTGENNSKSNGDAPDHQRCFRDNQKGHYKWDWDTEESKFIPRCEKCSGFGHTKEKCPSVDEVATLAIQLPERCSSLE